MPDLAMLDYFYGDEAEQFTFYRIPKVLFTDPSYRRISSDAKILYGLMLDRMGLSVRNGWLDEYNRVFIFFTLEDALEYLCCGHAPVENPFEPVGKEIALTQSGGIPCGLVYKHEMEGFILADKTVLLQKERDAHGNYYGGISLDGMMFKIPKMYAPVTDETGRITAFRQMREKDFSRGQPQKKPEKKPSIREQLAKKPEQHTAAKPPAKRKDLER